MSIVDPSNYLSGIVEQLKVHWPENRIVNIVCHGHSVPAGNFAPPFVDTFNAYPYLLHRALKERFPYAVINVTVTAIGGENSESGAARFKSDVFCRRPDVLTIDYALNDRDIGLSRADRAWRSMIDKALDKDIKLLLLTPTADVSGIADPAAAAWTALQAHANMIRKLAAEYDIGLADSLAAFERYAAEEGDLTDLLSWSNHPNRHGHELVTRELMRWFPVSA